MPFQYKRRHTPLVLRFWLHVDTSGGLFACWPWRAARNVDGYGRCWAEGADRKSHVVAWRIENGDWPPADLFVCHTCDSRSCCNPSHLFLGTPADNSADMVAKGRAKNGSRLHPESMRRGVRHPMARLTEDQIEEIRALYPQMNQTALAAKFGVSQSEISDIVRRKIWRHT